MSERSVSHPVLLFSLAINLLLIGALAGEWVSGARRPPPPMQWATSDLDEATRARVRQILEEQRPAARTLRHDLRAIDQQLQGFDQVIPKTDIAPDNQWMLAQQGSG